MHSHVDILAELPSLHLSTGSQILVWKSEAAAAVGNKALNFKLLAMQKFPPFTTLVSVILCM